MGATPTAWGWRGTRIQGAENWKEVEWRCGRAQGGVGTVSESLGHPVELGSGAYFDSMWPLRREKGNGM